MKTKLFKLFRLIYLILFFIPFINVHADITTGLVGHWKFDDASGTVASDSSGNNNNSSLKNDPLWTTGKIGGGLQFDGVNDKVEVVYNSTLNLTTDLTVSAWVKFAGNFTGANNSATILAHSDGGWSLNSPEKGYILHCRTISNQIYCHYNISGSSNHWSSENFTIESDSNWHHIVGTTQGNIHTLYIDGVNKASVNIDVGERNVLSSFFIGDDVNGSDRFAGFIDEVRVYNRSLSSAEILELYNYTGSGTVPPSQSQEPTPLPPPPIVLNQTASTNTYWVSSTGVASWANCKSDSPLDGVNACSLSTSNSNVKSGDTVYLRGGVYLLTKLGDTGIAPIGSGLDINNRITYKAFNNEIPIIKGSGCYDCGIGILLNRSNKFIKIDGITFLNLARWGMIINNSSHNEILNSTFKSETGQDVVMGFFIGSWCLGGSKMDCYSTHNWIHDNHFSKAHRSEKDKTECYEGRDLFKIGDPPNPAYGYYSADNNYNTVENNLMEYAGHALFDSYGAYTVFRNNTMHNEGWIPDVSGGTCSYPPMPDGNYGHRLMQISEDFGREGVFDLIEGNRMGYSSANPNNPGEAVFAIAAPKNIIRQNYIFGGQQAGIYFKYAANGRVGAGGTGAINNRVYNNTLFHNGYTYPYMQKSQTGCSTCPGKLAGITIYSSTIENVIKNNIVYDNYSYLLYGGLDITVDTGKDPKDYPQIAKIFNNWTTSDGNPNFINPDISNPKNIVLPDLRINSNSPVIDKGSGLTKTTNSGTSSTVLKVEDALYFQDGSWGSDLARGINFFPDTILVGNKNNITEINSIDYKNNIIYLKSPITWAVGDEVYLYKNSKGTKVFYGAAPDVGAYEFVINNEAGASASVPTQNSSPTYPVYTSPSFNNQTFSPSSNNNQVENVTTEDPEITRLQALIASLLKQLADLQMTKKGTASSTPSKLNITRTLYFGMRNTDVSTLQTFLISKGYLTQGNATGYFGNLTRQAVQKFQCDKLRICSGSSTTNGYGVVGPKTRVEMGR